jgi:type III secretion protein V
MRSFSSMGRFADLALAVGVVGIIATMIVRVPPGLMDVLIAVNIGVSVSILLAALYITDPKQFPSLPTILLLTTLFRLALNVSTTRLILLEAHAGDIIDTFGNFVVQGNFVVGGIVFIVITLVQFIVVTKGSERSAEVSARFTLDALPQKQMAIEADQRMGIIDNDKARELRDDIERESKLYGAMEGSMKFIKGDAIAGIVISLVNIIGGLIIGVSQQNMTLGESAQLYALLTIGDGLVTQIPSLLMSISAGLVITRVASRSINGAPPHVATDMIRSVLGQPRAMSVAAGLMVLLAVTSPLTGFPVMPFLLMGATMVAAIVFHKQLIPQPDVAKLPDGNATSLAGVPQSTLPRPLAVHAGQDTLLALSNGSADGTQLARDLDALRKQIGDPLGIDIPPIALEPASHAGLFLAGNQYAISLYAQPIDQGELRLSDTLLTLDWPTARDAGYDYLVPPWKAGWLYVLPPQSTAPEHATKLTPRDVFFEHLRRVVTRHTHELLDIQVVSDMLDRLNRTHGDLVRAVVPTLLTAQQLTEVLQKLVREEVPVRDLRLILEHLSRLTARTKDTAALAELLRKELARSICNHWSTGFQQLAYYPLDWELEQLLADKLRTGPRLELGIDDRRALVTAVQTNIDWYRTPRPVLVTSNPLLRLPLKLLLIERGVPDVAVLAYSELPAGFTATPLRTIALESTQPVATNGATS